MRRHTLFLLQDKQVQEQTLDIMREWSGAGFLHEVSFIDLGDIADGTRPQDALHHVLVDGVLQPPAQLLDWLADNYCDVLRLVALHTSTRAGDELDGVRTADQLQQEIARWLGADQRLLTIACYLVDPDESQILSDSVRPTWTANLVISPTDQALPTGATAPVPARDGRGEPNHAFAALASQSLCTIGGAWAFVEDGPLDGWVPNSGPGGVQVARCFVRSLDLPDPTVQVTEEALRRATGTQNWPLPASSTVPAPSPEMASADAAEQVCRNHRDIVDLVDLPPPIDRPKVRIRLWAAIKMFVSFILRGVIDAPRVAVNAAVAAASTAASTMATSMIFGRASEFEVTVGRPRLRPTADVEDLQRALESAIRIADPTTAYMPPSTKDLWQDYMRVGVALLDGSAMPPNQIRPQVGDTRAVILDPAEIVVRPDQPELVIPGRVLGQSNDESLSSMDPLKVHLVQTRLQARLASLTGSSDENGGEDGSRSAGSESGPSTDELFDDPDDAVTKDGPAAEGDGADPAADGRSAEAKRKSGEKVLREVKTTQEQLTRLDEWIRATRQPFGWKVGERIAASLATSELRLIEAASVLQEEMPRSPRNARVERKPVFLRVGIGTAVAVVFIVLGLLDRLDWPKVAVAALIGIAAGVLAGFLTFLRELKRQFQYNHMYEAGIDRLNEATRRFSHYARESLRLNSVYWQYLQWTPILSSLLHDPFAGSMEEPAESHPMLLSPAPRATRSATATADPSKLETLIHEARRSIFSVGWAQRAWKDSMDHLSDDYRSKRAIDESLDPYDENIRNQTGLLEYIRGGFLVGAHGRVSRRGPEEKTRSLVTHSSVGEIATTVLVDGTTRYPDAPAPRDADPASGIFDEVMPGAETSHFAPNLWRKAGLGASTVVHRSIIAMAPGWERSDRSDVIDQNTTAYQHDGRLLFAATRVDLSEACLTNELTVFDDESADSGRPLDPVVGDPDGD